MTQPQAQDHQEPQNQEEAGRTLPWSLRRERGPVDTWISDFWPLELGDNNFLLLYATSFGHFVTAAPGN